MRCRHMYVFKNLITIFGVFFLSLPVVTLSAEAHGLRRYAVYL